MNKTLHHMSLDIAGALRRAKDLRNCITVGGKLLTTEKQVKQFLEYQLSLGRKVLPFGECEGFDYITGCPGHIIEGDDAL